MDKREILRRIAASGLVAIVRATTAAQAMATAKACAAGGAAAIEVAYTTPGTTDVIRELAAEFQGEIILGAGTVLDPATARTAILAGAQYIVTPALQTATLALCNRYQVATMPGAQTVGEVLAALAAGADLVKVFPGESLGPAFVRAVKGPLPQAPLMPTGGVSLGNVADWIKSGAIAVGVGGSLTAPAGSGDYTAVTELARQFTQAIQAARQAR